MSTIKGKAVVAQGGGPTAVINQSLAGVFTMAQKIPEIERIYGALHGVSGIVAENFVDLTQATTHNLESMAHTVSAGLLSTRDKPDEAYCHRIFESLKAHDVRYLFYIGGNDSADTCYIVNEQAAAANYELRVIHIPKTIDNDLRVTDHCPGYGSAAKFVALAFSGTNLDNRAIPGVYLGVVMGRNAGFLTAASVFAKRYADDGPHLIYLPERNFSVDSFLSDIDGVMKKNGRCVIAVSEGITDANGTPIMAKLQENVERDAHGNVQLSGIGALGDVLSKEIKDKLSIKRVRADTFGYLQRCFPTVISKVDANEAREVGEKAVQYAAWENVDGSVAIRRTGDYSVEYFLTPLDTVAKVTKKMPDDFIEGNNMVTGAFKNYARPFLGTLPYAERVSAPIVEKILHK